MRNNLFTRLGVAILCVVGLLATQAGANEQNTLEQSEGETLSVELEDSRVESLRLEVFDAVDGTPIFDSGIRSGRHLSIDLDSASGERSTSSLTIELRAWDASGDLLLSQVSSTVAQGGSEITSINFERIPAGITFLGSPITLDGNVEVSAGLEVTGSTTLSELRGTSGGPFIAACSPNSSIRSINANGSVACEPDNEGGNDNLGNHNAQQDLQMNGHTLRFNNGIGLESGDGAEIKTGGLGKTFQLFSGGPDADIARFKDHNETLKLSVTSEGGLNFNGGLKICSTYDSTGRTSVVASAGWTPSTCSLYRDAVAPTGSYQLACVFETTFSFGTANGGIPPQDCGWQ